MEPHLIVELLMQYLDRQPENDKLRIRLYMALRQAILDRALAQGVKLPPTRVLATDLRLGRNTVVRAYEQLLVEVQVLIVILGLPLRHLLRPTLIRLLICVQVFIQFRSEMLTDV